MKVELIDYQKNALEILLYTKNTRLQGECTLEDVMNWPEEKKLCQLAYMKDTIKSSWEFAQYIFKISGVTRALTHQLVRTRTAGYAQESMRSTDASNADWLTPPGYDANLSATFDAAIVDSISMYKTLIEENMPRQDARGVLPTNICTSIMMTCNLRTIHQMAELRLCTRTQGEYQDVFREMRKRVIEVHPWAAEFIQVFCVNHGTCAFPRYTECPIRQKKLTLNDIVDLNSIKKNIQEVWESERHEANVVSKSGETM